MGLEGGHDTVPSLPLSTHAGGGELAAGGEGLATGGGGGGGN